MAADPTTSDPVPDASSPGIEIRGLHKRYGERDALRGVDLDVARGAFFGMLGPNGAGKTTLVGILTTLLDPSEGSARLLGRDVVAERAAVRRSGGVVFQDDLEDFLTQIQSVRKMGSLSSVMEMIPGMGQISKKMSVGDLDDGRMERIEAIIRSMTPQERQRPEILNGSRRRRISRGSGTTPADVNQLLNQFKQTQKMMKQMAKSRNPMALMKMLKG